MCAQSQLTGLTSEFGATARSAQSMLGGLFGRKRVPAPDVAAAAAILAKSPKTSPSPSPKAPRAPAARAAPAVPALPVAPAGGPRSASGGTGGTGSRSDMPPSVLARLATAGGSGAARLVGRPAGGTSGSKDAARPGDSGSGAFCKRVHCISPAGVRALTCLW